jgi:hypothetical protein
MKVHIDWSGAPPFTIYADGLAVGTVWYEGISWTLRIRGRVSRGFASVRDICRETRKILRAKP